jgi:hypothetical protein
MTYGSVTEEELAKLIQGTAEAAKAYFRGDMRTYFTLIRHGDDYTLMSPFGGEPTRGSDTSPKLLEALERYFRNGEAELDVVQTYTSGDLVVLVVIERQHGKVKLREEELRVWNRFHFYDTSRGIAIVLLLHFVPLLSLIVLIQKYHLIYIIR